MMFVILAIFLGWIAGAVINALADDLPQFGLMEDDDQEDEDAQLFNLPHYPDGTQRPRIAWSGLLAFLTGKHESPGGAKLRWRHPITEIAAIALFALSAYIFGAGLVALFTFAYLFILILTAVIDIEYRFIFPVVLIPGYALAVLEALVTDRLPFGEALLGGLFGFGFFFIFYAGGNVLARLIAKWRGYKLEEVPFGYGDVYLGTFCGLMVGSTALTFALFITVFAGGIGALVYLLVKIFAGGYKAFAVAIPYGPYIILGAIIMLFWRDDVRDFLINLIWMQ